VQGRADADHACAQHQNIGPEFRHPALRKLNVARAPSLPTVNLVAAASSRKPAAFWKTWLLGKSRLRGGQTLATMHRSWLSILQK